MMVLTANQEKPPKKLSSEGSLLPSLPNQALPWIICGRPYSTPKVLSNGQQDAADDIGDQDRDESGAGGEAERAGGERAGG